MKKSLTENQGAFGQPPLHTNSAPGIHRPAKSHALTPGQRLIRWLAPSALLLLPAALLYAGFAAWGGLPLGFGDGTDSDANKRNTTNLVNQLMKPKDAANPFGPGAGLGLTQAEAEQRVKDIRNNVKKMVDLAKKQLSEECAGWLQKQFDNGNICISWGMTARGTVDIDSATGKQASEKVAIYAQGVVDGPLECYDARIVILAGTIAHETTHAAQSYATDGTGTAAVQEAKKGKVYACNEVAAHTVGGDFRNGVATALCDTNNLNPTTPLPTNMAPAIKCVVQAVRDITDPTQRAAAATALKDQATANGAGDTTAVSCYTVAKDAFDKFIAGLITRAELQSILNSNTWQWYTGWLDSNFVATVPPEKISQHSVGTGSNYVFDTGLHRVMHFAVVRPPFGKVLLVTGQGADGLGEMQGYADFDGDGLFNASPKLVFFAHEPRLRNNMSIIHDPSANRYFVYDSVSATIMTLPDTNGDGVPDSLGMPVNAPDTRLRDYVEFYFDVTAPVPTILGYLQVDTLEPAAPHDARLLVLRDVNRDGLFESINETTWDQYVVWDPTFEFDTALGGEQAIEVFGMPGANLLVFATNPAGDFLDVLGSAPGQGIAQSSTCFLNRPLLTGEQIVLVDVLHNRLSPNYTVPPLFSPSLDIALAEGAAVLSWPRYPRGFDLEYADTLGNATVWYPYLGRTQLQGDRLVATDSPDTTLRVYRLHRQAPPAN